MAIRTCILWLLEGWRGVLKEAIQRLAFVAAAILVARNFRCVCVRAIRQDKGPGVVTGPFGIMLRLRSLAAGDAQKLDQHDEEVDEVEIETQRAVYG